MSLSARDIGLWSGSGGALSAAGFGRAGAGEAICPPKGELIGREAWRPGPMRYSWPSRTSEPGEMHLAAKHMEHEVIIPGDDVNRPGVRLTINQGATDV